jgi:hypothetical protein
MGRGYKNAIYADIYSVASFAPFFTKCVYVSAGNWGRTKVMGGWGTRQKHQPFALKERTGYRNLKVEELNALPLEQFADMS